MLVDRDGQVRLSLRKHHGSLHEEAARSLVEALREGRPVMTDLHAGPADLPPHIDVVAPLFSETDKTRDPNGAVILQIDARQFLYPLIQFWPTPSVSAETLLVRKEGDAVLFLNDLRHQPDTALKLRIPLSKKNVPAVMAVLGKEGIVQGTDYRGVGVLSVLKAVPNSPWFMVSKMDEAEALAGWRFRSILILVLVIALLAFLFTAVGVVWQKTGKAHYKELFLAETALRKAEEGHRITLMSVGDGIISTDVDGRVEILNPVAEALTGWRQEEARGKPLEEVFRIFNEETRQPVKNPVSKVLKEGLVVGLANHTVILAREGTERPIADSAAPIRDEHGKIIGVVLVFRDQSEQRAAQRLLTQEKEKAQQYLDVVGVMLIALDTSGHVTMVNRKGCEILGYQEGDILGKDWFEHFLPDKVRDEVKGAFSRIISGHLEMDEYLESVVLTNSGEARLIAWHNSILRDQDGSIIGTLSSGEDITERKAVEEALRESEERLNYVLEGSSDGFWDWHIESGEVRRNERWAQMLGYSFEDIAFTVPQWADLVHPEDKDKAWRSITDHLEGRTPQHEYEYRMLTKDGAWKWILDRAKVVERDGNGVPIRMAGTHTDITERKNAEEALRESEEKHRTILASIEEGYFEVDLAGNMTFCNEPLSRMLGYTNEELIGMNNREYMDANNAKQVYEAFNRVYRTGKPEGGFGWKLVRKDGTLRNVEASVSLIKDSEGKPCGFRGVVRDVTERKKMEEALRESEERYRAVFDNAGIGIDLLDRDGRILQVNQSLSDMLGYSEEELRQLTFQDITYPEEREVSKSKLEALMAGEIDFYRLEKRYLRKDRSFLWADLTTSAIRGPKGEHLGTIGVVSDITDRKKVEGALRESEDQYRTLMTASPDAMFVDVNGSIVYANDSAAKMFDVESPELLIGKSPQDLVHPEELEEVQARIETRYNDRTADSPHEQKFLGSNENVIIGEVAAVPTTFQGKPAILVVVRDISERKRLEEFALQSARLRVCSRPFLRCCSSLQQSSSDRHWEYELVPCGPGVRRPLRNQDQSGTDASGCHTWG